MLLRTYEMVYNYTFKIKPYTLEAVKEAVKHPPEKLYPVLRDAQPLLIKLYEAVDFLRIAS